MRKLLLTVDKAGRTWAVNLLYFLCVPTAFLFLMEWMHRGTLFGDFYEKRLTIHKASYVIAWLLLVAVYLCLVHLFGRHWPGVLLLGTVSCGAGVVCYYKLKMRGEPFLPWDFSQLEELFAVSDKVTVSIEPFMLFGFFAFALLFASSWFVHLPYQRQTRLYWRAGVAVLAAAACVYLVFGIFLKPEETKKLKIYPDMWMQDRYYKNYGVITGFLTNLTALDIAVPDSYSEKTVTAYLEQTKAQIASRQPLFPQSYGATQGAPEQQPNIIYVMNESFWDANRLQGVQFDREVTPNLTKLKEEAASGYCFTPSFGGGTCDVEFEALTGFAVTHLPSGCKPYQQHVTKDLFSLPQYLRSTGYDTVAVHGYNRKFWSRISAYPNLGINTFIASEDFVEPEKRRGFISDAEMTRRVIAEYEARVDSGPVFMHAVTMQNHTTYDAKNYPAEDLVQIVEHPDFTEQTLSQLQDFATGVYEADAALGQLVEYFRSRQEPVIVVFWGDHFNPMGKDYEIYEKTGFIEQGDTTSPNLRETDLMIWSNYDSTQVDLGTFSSYNISPVMMELYGLEKPLYFEYLTQNMKTIRGRAHGVTVEPDSETSENLSPEQEKAVTTQWLLQYDLMFGQPYQKAYTLNENALKIHAPQAE